MSAAGPAQASGFDQPVTAPSIVIGQSYTGNNSHCVSGEDGSYCLADLWRLPPLLLGDVVTVAWKHEGTAGPRACLTGNVDQYSWSANHCNIAGNVGGTNAGLRTKFVAKATASPAFLEFNYGFGFFAFDVGIYTFTVETVQNLVSVSIPAQTEIGRSGTISISPRRVNGAPVAGRVFTLTAKWDSGGWSTTATTDVAGNATFQLGLPADAAGKQVTFKASAPETVTDQAAASADTMMRVGAGAAVVTPPAVAKYPVLRVWSYKQASRLELDVDPNLGWEWKVRLQKLKSGNWVTASTIKLTKKTHRKFNPKRGTYRVVVYAKNGYSTAASSSVYIRR